MVRHCFTARPCQPIRRRAILNDENTYPEPARFRPERYLKDGALDGSVLDPRSAFFGYGRRSVPGSAASHSSLKSTNICRICPGRHVADAELWLLVATVLTCFDIRPAKDEHGVDILPPRTMSSGIVRYDSSHRHDRAHSKVVLSLSSRARSRCVTRRSDS